MQTPGGTGAVRLALALAKKAGVTRVLMGTPSWPNHAQIFADLGLELVDFQPRDRRRHRPTSTALRGGAGAGPTRATRCCCTAAATTRPGSTTRPRSGTRSPRCSARARCCRSSTSPTRASAQGMEEDAYGVRRVIAAVPEALIAYSCDKNFGLYRDRVGALYV